MVKERFDIVILKELFFFKSIQMFLEILRTPQLERLHTNLVVIIQKIRERLSMPTEEFDVR